MPLTARPLSQGQKYITITNKAPRSCRVVLGVTKWITSLLEGDRATGSTYLWSYIRCVLCTFVSQSSPVTLRLINSSTLLRPLRFIFKSASKSRKPRGTIFLLQIFHRDNIGPRNIFSSFSPSKSKILRSSCSRKMWWLIDWMID